MTSKTHVSGFDIRAVIEQQLDKLSIACCRCYELWRKLAEVLQSDLYLRTSARLIVDLGSGLKQHPHRLNSPELRRCHQRCDSHAIALVRISTGRKQNAEISFVPHIRRSKYWTAARGILKLDLSTLGKQQLDALGIFRKRRGNG